MASKAHGSLTVDQLCAVVDYPLDLTLLLQMSDRYPSKRAVNLQPLNEDALADKPERRNFLDDTVVCRFVKRNSVLGLILDLSLRPLLFLSGLSSRGCCSCLCFGLDEKGCVGMGQQLHRSKAMRAQGVLAWCMQE